MRALVIVDVQNDFTPGGNLEVPRGDIIISAINSSQKYFDLVVATQDWHPQNHKSFASNHPGKKPFDKIMLNGLEQILWPDHCIQGSYGADLFFCGLAADICVYYSIMDSLKEGFRSTLIEDASRPLSKDVYASIKHELLKNGGHFTNSNDLL